MEAAMVGMFWNPGKGADAAELTNMITAGFGQR